VPELIENEPLSDKPEEILFEGHPALLPSISALLVTIVTLGLALIFFAIRRKTTHYKITTERIVIETGLFSKRMDQVDIYRINDYVVERPFSQRLLGTGNLILSAMDRTTPEIRLVGLDVDLVPLYEKLREATETEKRRRGVRMIDYE
jgi:uncharacterized membrane protein YdbT with pleckstrin-like domain